MYSVQRIILELNKESLGYFLVNYTYWKNKEALYDPYKMYESLTNSFCKILKETSGGLLLENAAEACLRNARRLFIILFVRNVWRVCSQVWLSVREFCLRSF